MIRFKAWQISKISVAVLFALLVVSVSFAVDFSVSITSPAADANLKVGDQFAASGGAGADVYFVRVQWKYYNNVVAPKISDTLWTSDNVAVVGTPLQWVTSGQFAVARDPNEVLGGHYEISVDSYDYYANKKLNAYEDVNVTN